jgi:hypothetical protein
MIQRPGEAIPNYATTLQRSAAGSYRASYESEQSATDAYDARKAATWADLLSARQDARNTLDAIIRIEGVIDTIPAGGDDYRRTLEFQLGEEQRRLPALAARVTSLAERMNAEFGEQHSPDY